MLLSHKEEQIPRAEEVVAYHISNTVRQSYV